MDKELNLGHIKRIDIEPQSYCNRKCDWCPNKTFDRTFKKIMPDEVFTSLMHQIADAKFGEDLSLFFPTKHPKHHPAGISPIVSFLGYQEIFSCPELLKKRVTEARQILDDKICYVVNTNGDLLTKDMLDNLLLTNIAIMDYDCRGVEYWTKRLKELDVLVIGHEKELNLLHGVHRYVESITVFLDWPQNNTLENRGGYFKQGDLPEYKWANDMKKRTVPCPEPEYFINIAYDGSVMPCCHMRPDNPDHQDYILGNIKDTPLIDIYYSEKAENLRKKLREPNGDYPEPCKYCQKIRVVNCYGSPSGWDYTKPDDEE